MSFPSVHAAAISRLDGGKADGIHLLFEAPASAGYSIDGFDIQRREALKQLRQECVSLSADQLQVLHERLSLTYEFGLIEVRAGACPVEPQGFRAPPEPKRICVRFDERSTENGGRNPLEVNGAHFTVFAQDGRPVPQTTLVQAAGRPALDGGMALLIDLPEDTQTVELTLVATAGAVVEAIAGGRRVDRTVLASADAQSVELQADGLRRLRVTSAEGGLALVSCCWAIAARPPQPDVPPPIRSRLLATMVSASATAERCIVYDFGFAQAHDQILIEVGVPIVLAIALWQGKATATAGGAAAAGFAHRRTDQVLVYTRAPAPAIRVCVDIAPSDKDEELAWPPATTIAKNVNFPVRAVNTALATPAEERLLADSRLLPGEVYDPAAFEDATRMLNAAAAVDPEVAPVWSTTLTREQFQHPFVEIRSWAYATLPKLDPQWRRMLGLAYLDPGAGLTPGHAYDYRVIGRFRRRDVAERLLGFQAVPIGTALPPTFALGEVLLTTLLACVVEMRPAGGTSDLEVTGRKGIELKGVGFFGGSLRIELPTPVLRLALDVDPGHSLSYQAPTSAVLTWLAPATFSGAVPARAHAVLDFGAPVDTITLHGDGMFYGLRLDADPVADPDDVLTVARVIAGVVYEATADPDPPAMVGADNLQAPPMVAPAAGHAPPSPLGFRVSWLPPAGATTAWPPDLAAAPPFDVLGFGIERRRVDTGGPWQHIAADTTFMGSRGTQPEPLVLYPGQDLLSVFPEGRAPHPPVSPFIEAEDPLERTGADPPPGSMHQYRVDCVDAIGRRSVPALGPIVRLEKHTPPPPPAGRQDTPPDLRAPAGVTARVLQAADPALSTADRTLLGAAATAVVIEWGWTDEQRARDPYATEFRVYWESSPPDAIEGELTGTATSSGANWRMAATMQRAVAADAMVGRHVRAGRRPFQVVSNTAGSAISVELRPSAIEPAAVPAAGAFVFQPLLDGSELRPGRWERRSAIVPLGAASSYRHLLAETVTLDVAHPRARVWTGVSAADAQSYVADELSAAAPLGGRPGNESSIVVAPAAARWIGRPTFTVPLPLPDVPELRTNEPNGDDVKVRLDLPALLAGTPVPAGHRLLLERLSLADVVAALGATATGAIRLAPPAGAPVEYTLANAADQAALLAQIRSGVASTVERRFLMDALLRGLASFETAWVRAAEGSVTVEPLEITLPSKAERYAIRVRIVDALGNVSAGAAVLERVLRVPSLRTPAPPALALSADASNALGLSARVRDVPDLAGVLFFSTAIPAGAAPTAELIRTPNRPDLYPAGGIRLRLADGTLLAPSVVAASTGVAEVPDRIVSTTLVEAFDRQVAVWAATLTRDGVPSRLAGPSVAMTGPAPLVVPALAVIAAAGEDHASWTAPGVGAELGLERSEAGGPWSQVSPWLPSTVTNYILPGRGPRAYRLALRARRSRRATGPAFTVS